jgi:D-methionine transport system permease protein
VGVLLYVTRPGQIVANAKLYRTLSALVNIFRSIPFIILLVWMIPFTRVIVGTSIGLQAAIVPLTVGAAPFIARMVENALLEIPTGLIEASRAMGATPLQIVRKVLLPEALPGWSTPPPSLLSPWWAIPPWAARWAPAGGRLVISMAISATTPP